MACTPQGALNGITYDCANIIGGIKQLFVGYKRGDGSTIYGYEDITGISIDDDYTTGTFGQITLTTPSASGDVFQEIQFNLKDGVSVFTDVVTISADGTKEVVPTIVVELPLMDAAKMTEIATISQTGAELVALVATAAGTYHLVGADFGLYAGTVDGSSGTGRAEKNRYQLTLTGSEGELAYQFTSPADFAALAAI